MLATRARCRRLSPSPLAARIGGASLSLRPPPLRRQLSAAAPPPLSLPDGLRESKAVIFSVAHLASQLEPKRDGGFLKAVGMGDRGSGLTYHAPGGQTGRLTPEAGSTMQMPPLSACHESGMWLLKVQAPMDLSSDGAGGIGRMTPDTLLLHDASLTFCVFIAEEETGHTTLLRAALRHRSQVGYLFAEEVTPGTLKVYTDLTPDRDDPDGLLDW